MSKLENLLPDPSVKRLAILLRMQAATTRIFYDIVRAPQIEGPTSNRLVGEEALAVKGIVQADSVTRWTIPAGDHTPPYCLELFEGRNGVGASQQLRRINNPENPDEPLYDTLMPLRFLMDSRLATPLRAGAAKYMTQEQEIRLDIFGPYANTLVQAAGAVGLQAELDLSKIAEEMTVASN